MLAAKEAVPESDARCFFVHTFYVGFVQSQMQVEARVHEKRCREGERQ